MFKIQSIININIIFNSENIEDKIKETVYAYFINSFTKKTKDDGILNFDLPSFSLKNLFVSEMNNVGHDLQSKQAFLFIFAKRIKTELNVDISFNGTIERTPFFDGSGWNMENVSLSNQVDKIKTIQIVNSEFIQDGTPLPFVEKIKELLQK